ncbi:MAG: hypothetical protein IJG33_16100 [Selenomonadaceae bacterium]|nr:hypothetical protein [Selenomonadaceae bacterium]
MDTKKITVIPVGDETFTEYQDANLRKVIARTNDGFNDMLATLYQEFAAKFQAKAWIYLNRAGQGEGVYYVNDIAGLLPDLNVHGCNAGYAYNYINSDFTQPRNLIFAGFQGVIPSDAEARKLFNNTVKYFRESNGYIRVRNGNYPGLTINNGKNYMWTKNNSYSTGTYNGYDREYFWVIPIYKFGLTNPTVQKVLWTWLEFDLTPKDFPSTNAKSLFATLKKYKAFFKVAGDKITFDEKKIFEAIKAGTKFDFIAYDASKVKTLDGKEYETALREDLLSCDNRRVGLSRYDEKIFADPNRGHWDLWDLPEATERGINLSEPLYARNPAADINVAGIVAIDFGTKSTVVVYENERGEMIPLQVGAGDYSKGIRAENYENPTIIEFRHIDNFLDAYTARAGRPKTSIEDVTVSHMAQENLGSVVDSSLYASFFENLKQWCGNLQYTTKIRDHDGTEKDLPPFLDIAKDEFNPLEYYAYYLGSYINHMLRPNHIFLKYILSFPVTYERNIRERMIKAFRAGVLKSLPTALLANEEAMKDFQLVEGTSEPAAYAITALDGFGFLNGEDTDGIYYAVFDFGGGTTDFDFGVLKLAEDDDADFYDYVLTHFGAHGDRTLGGENLLRLMAFQVFRANSDKLLKARPDNPEVKIPFTWAAEKIEFAGSEALIRSSQEANLNMHNLMEALRPIWEAPDSDEAKKILQSGNVSVTLFDDTGKDIPEFNLSIGAQIIPDDNTEDADEEDIDEDEDINEDEEDIDEDEEETSEAAPKVEAKQSEPLVDVEGILRGRISRGIDSFFLSMRDAFDKVSGGRDNGIAALSDVTEIKIFLAGNSTKSALVNELFAEYTDTQAGKARELLGFGKEQKMPQFVLYPPLGTDAADKLQEENGVAVNRKNIERPTGKTGVAFGLLRCREGSAIRVVDITPEGKDKKQVPFQFYIGRARMGKFTIVIDKATKLGKWYKFIGAKLGVADLLYTDDSRALTKNAPASIAKRLTLRFEADAEASVYVKPVESNKICYAVTKDIPADNVEGTLITLD